MEACESNASKMPEAAMTKRQVLKSFKENLEKLHLEMMRVGCEDDYRDVRHRLSELIENAKECPELSGAIGKISVVMIYMKAAETGNVTRVELDFKLIELMHQLTLLIEKDEAEEFRGEVKNVLEEILTGSQQGKTLDEQVDFLIHALF